MTVLKSRFNSQSQLRFAHHWCVQIHEQLCADPRPRITTYDAALSALNSKYRSVASQLCFLDPLTTMRTWEGVEEEKEIRVVHGSVSRSPADQVV